MKRRLQTLLTFTLVCLSLSSAQAQSNTQKVWTLNDCMIYAVSNSYSARRQLLTQDNYKQSYTNAFANHFPSLSASSGISSNFGRSVDPGTNTYVNKATFNNNYGVSAGITVFNGFAMWNTTRYQKLAMLRGVDEQQKIEDDIALQTMMSYIEVVYNIEVEALAQEKLEESNQIFTRTVRQSELGLKSSADVAQAEANLAAEEFNLISCKNSLKTAILKLKDCMNYPIEDSLALESTIKRVDIFRDQQTLEDIYIFATKNLPDVLIQEKLLAGEKLQLRIRKANYYPSISLSGGISTSYYTNLNMLPGEDPSSPFGKQLNNNLGEYVSASLNIPIFRGLGTRSSIHIAKNNYRRAKYDYDEKLRTIKSEIEQAIMDMQGAEQEYNQARKKVEATTLAHKANSRKYEEGLLSIIELQTSSNQLLLSKIDMLNSNLRYIAKCRQVNYYKGIPFISE